MLTATNLTYIRNQKKLLNSASVTFNNHSVHAIIGINGAGKSTLLKILAGIWQPTDGVVAVDSRDIATWDRRQASRILSLVPQAPQVFFNYTVSDIVAMGGYPLGRAVTAKAIADALSIVDALHLLDRPIMEVSAGERQRVYIARALLTGSPILLLDEPTANLDIRHQIQIWDLMHHLGTNGKAVIVATHDLSATRRYCDTATLMHKGQVINTGSPNDVITDGALRDVFGVDAHTAALV